MAAEYRLQKRTWVNIGKIACVGNVPIFALIAEKRTVELRIYCLQLIVLMALQRLYGNVQSFYG